MRKTQKQNKREIAFPCLEISAEADSDGKIRFKYTKRFQAAPLRDLAHELINRSSESDADKGPDDYSDLTAAVIVLVTSLDCFLNDMLIAHARTMYGDDCKAIAEGFLGGTVRSRILRVIPIASNNKKRLDQGRKEVGLLFELIKVRNDIVHAVDHYIADPPDNKEQQPAARSLTLKSCERYASALDSFFAAVLSGMHVRMGQTPWDHELVVDAVPPTATRKADEKSKKAVAKKPKRQT